MFIFIVLILDALNYLFSNELIVVFTSIIKEDLVPNLYSISFQLTFWVWCPESRPKIGLSAFPIITLTVMIQPPVWPRPQQRRQMHYLQPIKFTDNYYTNYKKKDLSQSINVFYEKFGSVHHTTVRLSSNLWAE